MIKKGTKSHIPEILICFDKSKLKDNYFHDPEHTNNFLMDSISKDELYVYENNKKILAFIRIDKNGMLSKFPLLRCIAVNPDYRNRGIGKELLSYFEVQGFSSSSKVFLCVSDFNPKARKLYLEQGYKEIGRIEDLYKQGITEFILCKSLKI